jgi:hypothetical protein
MNGWRKMKLCFFESVAYYYYHNQADSAYAISVANKAKQLSDSYNVTCGFGNGVPDTL